MKMLKKGTPCTINNTTLSGEISRGKLSDDGETFYYFVSYIDVDGEVTERAFTPEQITITGEA